MQLAFRELKDDFSVTFWKIPRPKQVSKIHKEHYEILKKPVIGYFLPDPVKGTFQVVFADVSHARIVFSCQGKQSKKKIL